MSDLYRSAMSARLAKLPLDLPPTDDNEEEESLDGLGSLPGPGTGLGPPAMCAKLSPLPKSFLPHFLYLYSKRNQIKANKKEPNPAFAPISASKFFVQAFQVAVPNRNLDCRVYYTPPVNPNPQGTVMVCQHGAGYSGLSFACMAKEITDLCRGGMWGIGD